jgi:hypothetical protein
MVDMMRTAVLNDESLDSLDQDVECRIFKTVLMDLWRRVRW